MFEEARIGQFISRHLVEVARTDSVNPGIGIASMTEGPD
jgi:hypothetical protein